MDDDVDVLAVVELLVGSELGGTELPPLSSRDFSIMVGMTSVDLEAFSVVPGGVCRSLEDLVKIMGRPMVDGGLASWKKGLIFIPLFLLRRLPLSPKSDMSKSYYWYSKLATEMSLDNIRLFDVFLVTESK